MPSHSQGRITPQRPRGPRILGLCGALTVALALCGAVTGPAQPAAAQPSRQRPLPTNLSSQQVHPGSVVLAFRTPVRVAGTQVTGSQDGSDPSQVNAVLASLHATAIQRLFTNIPADKLNATRDKAMAATGSYLTDLTQVYQITFNPAINDGEAVNRLMSSPLVYAAMPDWVFKRPAHEVFPASPRAASAQTAQRNAASAARQPGAPLSLPPNYSYITDGQSYHDAASNNVTGAFAMLASSFGKTPGEGETITNISLGTIDDSSTVLEHGQRYLVQRGYPKIPVWLSSQTCQPASGGTQSCSVVLDPTATNTKDGQGDLGEVMLDFSVMAPPPRGDPRVPNPQQPGQLGEILGAAYGANYRLINPLVNSTPDFLAAWLGGGLLQTPAPTVMTASIGGGFPFGFSDYFFEQETIIHDIVTTLVNGADIFVTISAGDGQTDTNAAMNPNGLAGATEVTQNPRKIVDEDDPLAWANPNYSYGVTFEPQYLIDSGANSAGGNTLNDIFNNAPWNLAIARRARHDQHTTETRWTGQQNFHSGFGSRTNVAAPADDILYLAQVEDADGNPVNPIETEPELIGGTSASCPEIAAAAAVVRQTSKLLGHPLSARETRSLLIQTGRDNRIPFFDLERANIGQTLDLTRAVGALFRSAGLRGQPSLVRMTVAQRKAVPYSNGYGRGFYSDTPQNPQDRTATIDLSQGLDASSSFNLELIAVTGDNLYAPITFAVDGAYLPQDARFSWSLATDGQRAPVPEGSFDPKQPYIRLLPAEIFDALGLPRTAPTDRVVRVTGRSGDLSITTSVTFKGQANASYSHAIPPAFKPVYRPSGREDDQDVSDDSLRNEASDGITVWYDLRGLRDGAGGQVDGGVLIVSDIDRILPRAFPDRDPDSHGFKKPLKGLTGKVTISWSELAQGVGAYGLALRGTKAGAEVAGSTSSWLPLRYAPEIQVYPATPKLLAANSAQTGPGNTSPLFL